MDFEKDDENGNQSQWERRTRTFTVDSSRGRSAAAESLRTTLSRLASSLIASLPDISTARISMERGIGPEDSVTVSMSWTERTTPYSISSMRLMVSEEELSRKTTT